MRTRELLKYLAVMIMALNTSVNVFAQQRNLKIYFNEYATGETAPRMLVTDDNNQYGVPLGVTVSQEGAAWAGKSRFFEWVTVDVTDRVMADFVSSSDKKHSKLKLSFTSFPYEINTIQWNVMNDLLSGSVTNWFQNYNVTTKCVPVSGNGFSYTEEHWSMNIFTHSTTFNQGDIPWQSGATLNGLKSFEISEKYETKIGVGNWTWFDLGEAELNDKNRTFIKAGWNGKKDNTNNITDSDDSNWAFKVTFTLPDISAAIYTYDSDNKVALQPDKYVYVGESNVHALHGYISAHAGAVEPTYDPTDQSDFHFEYFTKNTESNFAIGRYTGAINKATAVGDYPVVVKLMRSGRFVCSTEYTVHVIDKNITSNSPVICIGFADGKKGYDISVGDENAQIKGFIVKNANGITPTENTSGYHFEYSEASNGEIITINNLTGDITPKKEGDVQVTAVLKNGNTVISNPYTYTLHVFAQHEGLEFRRINTYKYTTTNNKDSWKISDNQANQSTYEWNPNNLLRVNTSISGQYINADNEDNWKQIAGFSTKSSNYWRAISQEIAFDIYVPKYTKASAIYSFGGNVSIGTSNKGSTKYGLEFYYLNQGTQITKDEAYTRFIGRNWNTVATTNIAEAILRNGTDRYHSNIGDGDTYDRGTNNVDAADSYKHKSYTVYFAAMTYLWKDRSYPGDASFGFKGIPEYTYYTKITYAKNDGKGTIVRAASDWMTTTDKTETFKLFSNATTAENNNLKRAGYTFLGWSTDPNATTPEFEFQEEITIYDNVNGGGRGPVTLYAVWKPNNYIVTLHKNDYGDDETVKVTVTYGEPMPENIGLVAPTRTGYDFTGYSSTKTGTEKYYYDAELKSVREYDKAGDSDLYARWTAHTTLIHFDFNGGSYYTNDVTVEATYGKDMPTAGVPVPTWDGYTFGGYYYVNPETGKKVTYYNYDKDENQQFVISSARKWYNDVAEATLYAKWTAKTFSVILDAQGGTGGSSSVTATFGQPLPSGQTAPTKAGYDFKGYYDNQNQEYAESMGQDYGGTKYYNEKMKGVQPWNRTYGGVIYAHWAPKTYIVTFDLGDESHAAIFPDNVVANNSDRVMNITSDGKMKVEFVFGESKDNSIDLSVPKKPGYEMLGWYDSKGDLIVTVDNKDRHAYITDKNNYWQEEGGRMKWNYPNDLVLTAKFRCKYTVEDADHGPIIHFGSAEKKEIVEPSEDWLSSVVSDLVGAANEVGTKGNPVMVFDLRYSTNIWKGDGSYECPLVMESLQDLIKDTIISPNVLVYFNEKSYYADKCNNAILSDMTCPNLYVTDRFQMKIPYEFEAGKAKYERNKHQIDTNDPMWQQSYASMWGTLCLPYPVKNYNKHNLAEPWEEEKLDCQVIFYKLRKKSGNVMLFDKLPEDAVVDANTPILYERKVGVSSAVIIEEISEDIYTPSITVPMNMNFEAATTTYSKAVLNTEYDWQFIGNMKETIFYGKNYTKVSKDLRETKDNVYYIKKDNFTRLSDTNYMTLYPYRAYFREVDGANSDAKLASFSILVIDEEGATDITNAILGEGEGDGKIYDLNGVRVKQPVKGRLYIVNGKKKVYE